MSYDTHRNWVYQVVGRNIHLWQYVQSGSSVVLLDGYNVRLPADHYGSQLIYPDEDITDGLRYEGTAFIESFTTSASGDPNELDGNDNPTLSEDTSPSETSHVNLTRMLSLAVVDYIKGQLADAMGDIQKKEYYMREFWKKVGDNESNKRKISMSYPASPYGVR